MHNKKSKVYLRMLVEFSKIRSCRSGCASDSPDAHFLRSTAHIRQDISAASFCSCKLLWRSDECVSLLCSLIFLQLWTAVS